MSNQGQSDKQSLATNAPDQSLLAKIPGEIRQHIFSFLTDADNAVVIPIPTHF